MQERHAKIIVSVALFVIIGLSLGMNVTSAYALKNEKPVHYYLTSSGLSPSPATSTGNITISPGQSFVVNSSSFSSSSTMYSGQWTMNIFLNSSSNGQDLNCSIYAVGSSGKVMSVFASASSIIANTGPVAQTKTTLSGSLETIPSGGHLSVVFLSASSNNASITVYYSPSLQTFFQTPFDFHTGFLPW